MEIKTTCRVSGSRRESDREQAEMEIHGIRNCFLDRIRYLFFTGGRYSQLMGYFAYMSVACTLIPLSTPPYVIALGEVFHPGIVALVGAIGNCLAALAEYYSITWFFSRTAIQERIEANRTFQRFAHYFRRSAFVCLVFTGLTPIPFEPFRLAGILIRYNVPKYLLAVFLGRFPRYNSIALIGHLFLIPNRYLVVMFIVLIMILHYWRICQRAENASRFLECPIRRHGSTCRPKKCPTSIPSRVLSSSWLTVHRTKYSKIWSKMAPSQTSRIM